jgi:hypothetical protein
MTTASHLHATRLWKKILREKDKQQNPDACWFFEDSKDNISEVP